MKFRMNHHSPKAAKPIWERCFLLILVLVGMLYTDTRGFAVTVSAEPYPVGGLRIDREDITSSSFKLKISNLDLHPPENNRTVSRTWMIAGARGRVPTYTVESAAFALLTDGRETTRTTSVPDMLAPNFIRVADMGLFRQYWTYNFSIVTASPSGEKRFWVLTDAVIKIELGDAISGIDSSTAVRWKPMLGEDGLLASQLLNPNIGTEYYAMDYNDPVDSWLAWTDRVKRASSSGNMFRFRIYNGGVYRIDRDILDPATSGSVTTDVSQWKIFKDGQEVNGYTVPGISDALFLPVAIASDDGLRNETYWVDTSGSDSIDTPPTRLTPPKSELWTSEASTTSAQFIVKNREFNEYVPSHNSVPGMDRWFWTEVNNRIPSKLIMKIPEYYKPIPESKVALSIRYSFSNFPPILPKAQLYAEGREVGETSLTLHQGVALMHIDATALKPGNNNLAIVLVYPPSADSFRPVSLQAIETAWTQQVPKPVSTVIYFSEVDSLTTGTRVIQLGETPGATDIVIGFRDKEPQLLPTFETKIVLDGQPFSSIFYLNSALATSIPNVERVSSSFVLSDMQSARSVIIAATALTSGAERLKQMQEARGLSTVVYSVADIYDAFSYGNPNSNGIRSALRYLFNRATGEVPEYVTLVGEASDFRGNPALVPQGTQDDMVPASTAMTPNAPQGDNLYAAAIGSDLVGDLIVGRIPAPSERELADYLNKVQAFEAAPRGDWARIAEFAMDDNDEFPEVVSHILEDSLAPQINSRLLKQWEYEYVPNLRVQGVKRSWGATERILEVFNQGVGVLNFFGHGGPNLWSHERMLHLSDLPKIQNGTMLPLITCASCDSAWISYPTLPVKASMGEKLVLKSDGGAIGLFGPVAGASPYEHETLVRSLMEGLSRVQLRNIGDLVFYAKNQYYTITRSASIVDQYLLLGDPTVALPIPKVAPGLNATPTINAEGRVEVKLTLIEGAVVDSTGTLTLATNPNEDPVRLVFGKGVSQWNLVLPANFVGQSVLALLESYSADGPQLAGTMFPVEKKQDVVKEPQIVSSLGGAYTILPDKDSFSAGSASTRVFRFGIKAAEDVTTTVRIVASIDGKSVGEAARVEINKSQTPTPFDVTVVTPIESSATALTLEVFPLEGQNSDALTTVTVLHTEEAPAELEFVPGTARAYSKTGDLSANATVFFEAELRNSGGTTASNISLQALSDNPTTGVELKTINDMTSVRIGQLGPGESRMVKFRWEFPTPTTHTGVFIVANRNKTVRELDHGNNSIEIPEFVVQPMGNFSVESFEVSPEYATPGSTVTITAAFRYQYPTYDFPVTVEVGWNRKFDGETTSTRFPVSFDDGWATVTHELLASPKYTRAFIKINADLEIEESMPQDNSAESESMIVLALPSGDHQSWALRDSLPLGTSYNLFSPMDGVLKVTPEFTSSTDLLILDLNNVTTGSAAKPSGGVDDAWGVAPWQIIVESGEMVGPIGFSLPIPSMNHDLPGEFRAYFIKKDTIVPSVEISTLDFPEWRKVEGTRRYGDTLEGVFGELPMDNGAVVWKMKQPETKQYLNIAYFRFFPSSSDWMSPPYQIPEGFQGSMIFHLETNSRTDWREIFVDWRSGRQNDDGGIDWSEWNMTQNLWDVTIESEQYMQVRVLGVPVLGQKPYFENLKLIKP